jgi:hypothetical protein
MDLTIERMERFHTELVSLKTFLQRSIDRLELRRDGTPKCYLLNGKGAELWRLKQSKNRLDAVDILVTLVCKSWSSRPWAFADK